MIEIRLIIHLHTCSNSNDDFRTCNFIATANCESFDEEPPVVHAPVMVISMGDVSNSRGQSTRAAPVGDWKRTAFKCPEDAVAVALGIERMNGTVVLEDVDYLTLNNYIDLAKLCRKVYASH